MIALIDTHYSKGEGGRPAYPLMAMLRVHLMQNWFGYSDPAMEEALYEITPIRKSKKVFLIDRIQNGNNRLLYDLVLQRSNTQRALPAIGFGSVDPSRRRCPEGPVVKPSVQLGHTVEKTFLIVSPRHAVHAHRSIAPQGIKALRQ